ncbi:ferredoxin [Microbacterium sp. Clip185]|uniref:ferredoxin n=1 Tax=Microbacterium sp. Clip185 TaxID=3025663 RepID=UPI002366A710|nr:ferredoxin [Microbacterium sp. Clip185]WDG18398.1 ferredoxin [Microbacterium sp. Clip185]
MRITVDYDRCDGFGFCEQAAPELLRLDDDGVVQVLVDTVDEPRRAVADAAVRSCPVAALRLQA